MRERIAFICALGAVLCGCTGPALFVDQIENGRALLIEASGAVHRMDARALPADAGEGQWIGAPDPGGRTAQRRARLGAQDDGRDLVLGR